jgi:excisionase family DNA binding protein
MNNLSLITTAQAAALLNITPNYLRQLVYRKKIKSVYPGLFDPQEIERFAAIHPSPSHAIRTLIHKENKDK